MNENEQTLVDNCVGVNGFTLNMKKADALRQSSEKQKLNENSVYLILSGEAAQKPKPNRTPTVKVSKSIYSKYFKPDQPAKKIQETVEKALGFYFSHQQE